MAITDSKSDIDFLSVKRREQAEKLKTSNTSISFSYVINEQLKMGLK